MGQCICGAWNSFVEEKQQAPAAEDTRRRTAKTVQPARLKEVGAREYQRIDTGIGEFNRVLGGGLVRGSLVLISGAVSYTHLDVYKRQGRYGSRLEGL